jgi:HSP20 family molecular chaperone IbpA
MPGVKAKNLNIDLRDNILTLDGDTESLEGINESDILREYNTGDYFRQFTLSKDIDQSSIEADLNNGVLRLTLPKVETASPRKIAVKSQ